MGVELVASAPVVRRFVDIGGGEQKVANVVLQEGRPPEVIGLQVTTQTFGSSSDLTAFCKAALTSAPADQKEFVIPIAGPVREDGRIIEKLTNHTGVTEPDVPLSHNLETALRNAGIQNPDVTLVNDAVAAGYAETSPSGALGNVHEGLVMSLIIGNGVGAGLFKIENGKLVQLPGIHEFGHTPISWGTLAELRFAFPFKHRLGDEEKSIFLPADLNCGCGRTGQFKGLNPLQLKDKSTDVCLETLLKGPAIEEHFRRFLLLVLIGRNPGFMERFPISWMTEEELRGNALLSQVMERTNGNKSLPFFEYLKYVSEKITNRDVSAALGHSSQEPLSNAVLKPLSWVLAPEIERIQQRYNNLGPLSIVLVGGVGCHAMGQRIAYHMGKYSEEANRAFPQTAHKPSYHSGAFPSNHTNLIGAAYYLQGLKG